MILKLIIKKITIILLIFNSLICLANKKIYKNSLGQKFVYIKPGSFLMGSGHRYMEPTKAIIKKGFYIQTTEVTQGQWMSLMKKNPSERCERDENDYPIASASWFKVKEFIKKLNKKEKTNKYRLPTEAEWEYACRAGSNTRYSFGDDVAKLSLYAWYKVDVNQYSAACMYKQVARKKTNKWGLYDMHGNVQEWCEDWYSDSPNDLTKKYKVVRGGGANRNYIFITSYYRTGIKPDYEAAGFRIVMDSE